MLGKPLGGEASWIGVGRGTLLKEHVRLGMEGKGRCMWQSREEGPSFLRMAPLRARGREELGWDRACPGSCSRVGRAPAQKPVIWHGAPWGSLSPGEKPDDA